MSAIERESTHIFSNLRERTRDTSVRHKKIQSPSIISLFWR